VPTTVRTVAFSGPVSRDENRAAHGGVCHTEVCSRCGARRRVNVNGLHVEYGPWTPAERCAMCGHPVKGDYEACSDACPVTVGERIAAAAER
jgi:hypothetical protein